MGQVFYKITKEQLEGTIEALGGAVAALTEVLGKMQSAGMMEAYFPWTNRQWSAQDVITVLGDECKTKIQSQVNAFKQGRPSEYEKIKARSKRLGDERREKEAQHPPLRKKSRGRPRKGASS